MDQSFPYQETTCPYPATAYLFNENNFSRYKQAIQAALLQLESTMMQTEQPFSGITPKALTQVINQINLDKPLHSLSTSLQEIAQVYLQDAVYFHHPQYVAHLNCPIVYPALVAEMIISALNSSLDTWDQSVGGTLIEQKLIDWTAEQIGFDQQADGIFTSGGTQSNLMAMLLARDHYYLRQHQHSVQQQGLTPLASRFRIFTSALSHFSIQKACALLGLGEQAVIPVAINGHFQMDPHALVEQIKHCQQQDLIPIAVVSTQGTTDFGSFDSMTDLSLICQEYGLWLHADAAYGGGLICSQHYRDRLSHLQLADSVTIDYHKSFFQPVSCGAFLVKERQHLSVMTHHADYLNPLSQTQAGTPNLVNKSLQTTRRFDALKLWLTLRMMGTAGIGELFDTVIHLAEETYQVFRLNPQLEVIHQPALSTVIFRYLPRFPQADKHISAANEFIRKQLFLEGKSIIASTIFEGKSYLKFTLLNANTQLSDLEQISRRIIQLGNIYSQPKQAITQPVQTYMPAQSYDTLLGDR